MERPVLLAILAAISFLPPLALLLWTRARELRHREPLGAVLGIFLHGATLGVAMAIVLSVVLDAGLPGSSVLVAAIVIAPLVEELTKGLGFGFVRRHVDELEDGIVYGVAVGVGFAATETFLYGLLGLGEGGAGDAIVTVVARNVSSLLLHAGSSAVLGFGYARVRTLGAPRASLVPFYLVAVGLHALYNGLVLTVAWLGFVTAIVLVAFVMVVLQRTLRRLDLAPPTAAFP